MSFNSRSLLSRMVLNLQASVGKLVLVAGLVGASLFVASVEAQDTAPVTPAVAAAPVVAPAVAKIEWMNDYGAAKALATESKKMMLIWFFDARNAQANADFEKGLAADANLTKQFSGVVAAKLPMTTKMEIDGREQLLISHGAFAELQGNSGLAMIDYVDDRLPYYGHVVSAYPFNRRYLRSNEVSSMVTLPQGTITQRTLLFVIRCHPESPRSGFGRWHPILAAQCQDHSNNQASMNSMGHHNWGNRAANISGMLGGVMPQEVCAQSMGGRNMVEAAEELVNTWRYSPAHWQGVAGSHSYVGYDMKRGPGGSWFATGIFAGSY